MIARLGAALLASTMCLVLMTGRALADGGDGGFWGEARPDSPGVTVGGAGGSDGGTTAPAASGPATRTLTCDLTGTVSQDCRAAVTACMRPAPAPSPPVARVSQEQQPNGTWLSVGVRCNADAQAALAVTAAMVRQQVVKLLPPVAVGVAPANGPTLVNLETIFWSPTPPIRPLGPVTILGQQVTITIRFHHATYDYGDGTHATTTTPGTPWTPAACTTTQCPTLDGHTYTRPASKLTATTTITWTATYAVGGGPPQPIPGTIPGPTSRHDLQVLQGRSVIVR